MKKSLIKKICGFVLTLTMILGMIPMNSYAVAANTEDIINVTNGKIFTLESRYYEVLKNHPLFGTKDYIAYPWEDSYFIWFFNDDLSNVKFSTQSKGSRNFGLYPSEEVSFTEYVYDRETLELLNFWERSISNKNRYNYSYDFIASFDIYTDTSYSTYFYETDENQTSDTEPPVEDIINVTNGKTFILESRYYKVLKDHPLYGTKDYIAYPWEDSYFIWFFNEDLSNVKFSMWNRGTKNFGLNPSKELSFTEYVYDRETLEFIKSWDRSIDTTNGYNYSYEFMASFDIYTDTNYSTYFYEIENHESTDKPIIEFEPLEPDQAKDFLKFISNAGILVNIEEKLPEYYNLLIGEIQDESEKLKAKVSFLTYLYYCLDVQLAQSNERIDMGATYLIDWIEENTETSSIIYSEIQDAIIDSLKATIAENATLPIMQITGINIATAIIDYGDLLVASLGSITAIRSRDEIQYMLAYKGLLEAKAENDEIAIITAELACEAIRVNITFGANIEEMEEFAGYLFAIEQSLPI